MQTITPCIWTDDRIEEQAKFYTSVFPNSKITATERYMEGAPMPKGSVMTVSMVLDGAEFTLLNGGAADFKPNWSISFVVRCQTQKEVDHYWERMSSGGGEESQCGWVKDKYGVWWQITPDVLLKYMADKDPRKAQRTMQAMLKMKKIDIAAIERAYEG